MSTGTVRREDAQNTGLVAASSSRIMQTFHVPSRSHPEQSHVVRVRERAGVAGEDLYTCDCPGFTFSAHGLCTHVVAVSRFLDVTRGITVGAPGVTAKGLDYLRRWRAEQAQKERRAESEYHDRYETASVAVEWR